MQGRWRHDGRRRDRRLLQLTRGITGARRAARHAVSATCTPKDRSCSRPQRRRPCTAKLRRRKCTLAKRRPRNTARPMGSRPRRNSGQRSRRSRLWRNGCRSSNRAYCSLLGTARPGNTLHRWRNRACWCSSTAERIRTADSRCASPRPEKTRRYKPGTAWRSPRRACTGWKCTPRSRRNLRDGCNCWRCRQTRPSRRPPRRWRALRQRRRMRRHSAGLLRHRLPHCPGWWSFRRWLARRPRCCCSPRRARRCARGYTATG